MKRLLVALALAAAPSAMAADPAPMHTGVGTPWTVGKGHGRVGIFGPLAVGITDSTELSTSGLATLVAPRIELKQQLAWTEQVGLSGTVGIGVPTLGLKLLQGTALSSAENVGFGMVVKAGLIGGFKTKDVMLSLGVQGRYGVAGDSFDLQPPDLAWVNPMVAPLTEGPLHGTVRLVFDYYPVRVSGRQYFGFTTEVKAHFGGISPDFDGRLMAQYNLGRNAAFSFGTAAALEKIPIGYQFWLVPAGDFIFRW